MNKTKKIILILTFIFIVLNVTIACSKKNIVSETNLPNEIIESTSKEPIPSTEAPEEPEEPTEPTELIIITEEEPEEFRLTILHTNDWHGRIENVPQYSTIVKQVREEVENVLLLDGGDIYRRGPYEDFCGAAETEILNKMKYDAMVFGNNDFPLKNKELYDVSEHTILKIAEFPVVCGNVTIDGEYVKGFEPYIIKGMQGIKIAIIGVTSMKPHDRGLDLSKRYLFSDPVKIVRELALETDEISDIQIALSHAGIDADKNMRGVSAIIGGDDHMSLISPRIIHDGENKIPIVQTGGESDHYLGRLDLVYEKGQDKWVLKEFDGYLFSLDDVVPDQEIQDIIDRYDNLINSPEELPAA